MKLISYLISYGMLCLFCNEVKSQVTSPSLLQPEIFMPDLDESVLQQDVSDQPGALSTGSIDLNEVTSFELMQLTDLTEQQCQSIIQHRQLTGSFLSVLELQTIAEIDQATFHRFYTMFTVGSSTSGMTFKSFFKSRHHFIMNLERELELRKGFKQPADGSERAYLGSIWHTSFKYRSEGTTGIKYGFSGESDAGEKVDMSRGFDFISYHFFWPSISNHIKALAIGDYHVHFGHGLVVGTGMAAFKSSLVLSPVLQRNGIRPYRSLMESGFMRGLSMELRFGKFSITPFISLNHFDAREDTSNASWQLLSSSGLHRTLTEQSAKNKVTRLSFGGHFAFEKHHNQLGATLLFSSYQEPLHQTAEQKSLQTGIDYSFQIRNISFTGESSLSENAFAALNGIIIPADKRLDVILTHRLYTRNYKAPLGNGFGESSNMNDENGWYTGIQMKLNAGFSCQAYTDWWQHEWLKYRINQPSSGREWFGLLTWKKGKETEVRILIHHKESQLNHSSNAPLPKIVTRRVDQIGLQCFVNPMNELKCILKAQLKDYLFCEFQYEPTAWPVQFKTGIVIFKSDHITLRESDFPMQSSMISLYGEGMRNYMLLQSKIGQHIMLGLKYTATQYSDRTVIGSGMNEIAGNHLHTWSMQMHMTW